MKFTGDGTQEKLVCYKIDLPANRYDLLCLEGFARSIRIFLEMEKPPVRISFISLSVSVLFCYWVFYLLNNCATALQMYRVVEPAAGRMTMFVEPPVAQIRPYVVCAVLRGLSFDKTRYKSFIDLQEKLHQNICRKRTYVAIGTHDLDTLQAPFRYKALSPEDINFIPLTENNGKSYGGRELLDFYREDSSCKHLKPYTDIIYDSPVYPVIYDSAGTVLSMPPIINGKHSRIQMHTKNVFIECTATDLTKANIVLDTVVTMFSEYCEQSFTAEAVDIVYESSGEKQTTPLLSRRSCDAPMKDVTGIVGVDIGAELACKLCDRMQLGPAEYIAEKDLIRVQVPPTRSDVLHAVDVIEDIAIAYGYNNIPLMQPSTLCFGAPLPINQFCDLLRAEISRAGYMEMLTHGLCSTAENFSLLRRPVGPAVSLLNPANVEYEVVRTTLIPGALKTLAFNKSMSHKDGIKLFEISDVVVPETNEVGARNVRKIVALYSSNTAGFEVIHGLADRIMTCTQIVPEEQYAANSLTATEYSDLQRVGRAGVVYSVRPGSDPCFFPGMSAEIVLCSEGKEVVVGSMGVVHPEVLNNYDISYPCSILEMDVESLM